MVHNKNKPEVEIFYIFEAISKLSKPSEKIELLRKAKEIHPKIFNTIIKMVYQKDKFNVGEGILKKVTVGDEYTATFKEFVELASKAQQRKLTGKSLELAIADFFKKTDSFTAKWYKRILLKDLRIGVGENLIAQVQDIQQIKSFAKPMKAMLANDISESQLSKLFSLRNWYVEPKFDGFRAFTVITADSIRIFSYNGTRAPMLEQVLYDELYELQKQVHQHQVVTLDGEILSKDWNQSMAFTPNRKNPLSKSEIENLRYFIFDILFVDPTSIPRKTVINTDYIKRKQELKTFLKKDTKHLKYVSHSLITEKHLNVDFLSSFAKKVITSNKMYDGIVIKYEKSPYEFDKRSKYWIKFKEFETIDLLCVDVIKSEKRKDEIAAIVVMYKGKKVRVSGFKEEEAKLFYKHPQEIIGKIVEVKYLSVTKDGSLRHPTFVRIRHDKNTPDA